MIQGWPDGSVYVTFIVRLRLDGGEGTTVVVERVGTGEKARVFDSAAIGPTIAGMIGIVGDTATDNPSGNVGTVGAGGVLSQNLAP
jgi:hypothetical protein